LRIESGTNPDQAADRHSEQAAEQACQSAQEEQKDARRMRPERQPEADKFLAAAGGRFQRCASAPGRRTTYFASASATNSNYELRRQAIFGAELASFGI